MEHLLRSGTMLDGRYRVERVLGEGGFGITYAAENVRIGLKVAVKEFFWRGHTSRDVDVSPAVAVSQASDEEVFRAQKARFLKEGRILRDFSGLDGIAHILDYFEENGTAYIVMEYVEGVTLSRFLSDHGGPMEPEILFRRMLPLIDSLETIHAAGVIHRDISPDNIMVLPDGRLRLIDFGAARQLAAEDPKYTAIAKACYAPGEQYDKNGKQGPWTDVYALCATLYHCVAGAPPEGAIQRMFLDELQPPSKLGVAIGPEYEAVIMKGLAVDAAKRYQSMAALGTAIRDILPRESPAKGNDRKKIILSFAAGFACLAVLVGIWLYIRDAAANKFRGVETERLRVVASADMTAAEFADAQAKVRDWLETFAGRDNYVMAVDGAHMDVTLPLSVYDGREIVETTVASYNEFTGFDPEKEKALRLTCEIKANWEDPATSLIAGRNQVLPGAFREETLIFTYAWHTALTPGQRANMMVDFKTRLDALDVPYAFGTLYGDENEMVFCLPPRHMGRAVLDALGAYSLYLSGETLGGRTVSLSYYEGSGGSPLALIQDGDGPPGFRYQRRGESNADLEKLTQALLQNGENTVYLRTNSGFNLGRVDIDAPITDGRLDIVESCASDAEGGPCPWLYDFVDAVLNRTCLPATCYQEMSGVRGADGSPLFDARCEDYYDLRTAVTDGEAAFQDALRRIHEAEGLDFGQWFNSYGKPCYSLYLGLEADDGLAENVGRMLTSLIEKYDLADLRMEPMLFVLPIGESGKERCRIMLDSDYDFATGEIRPHMTALFNGEGRVKPCLEALSAWWRDFDAAALGYQKSA